VDEFRDRPFCDGRDMLRVHRDSLRRDDVAEEGDGSLMEGTFVDVSVESDFLELL